VLTHEESPLAQEEILRPEMDDARFKDLEEEEGTPFLRKQKRVSARRSSLPKKTTNRLKWIVLALVVLVLGGVAFSLVYRYGERSWRFRVESSDQIEIAGAENVARSQIMEAMGSDIGRNIFFVPLDERRAQLEQIPWVESAAVMRFVPNRLKVEIRERTPVAFARVGSHIGLMDATGHVMEMPAHNKKKYSFPVVAGARDSEPLSTRAVRMKVYNELVRQLDSEGSRYSQELSEVDLSDLEDAKVLVNDPSGDVLLHLGSANAGTGNFLDRFKLYKAHVGEWRQQFEKLESVDLRYERQIVVNPDLRSGNMQQSSLSATAAKAAVAAGVPAMAITAATLVKHQQAAARPAPTKAAAKAPLQSAHVAKPSAREHKRPAKKVRKSGLKKSGLKKPAARGAAAKLMHPAATHAMIGPQMAPATPHQISGKPHAAIAKQ
jgi:cell division protein FtsQ